MKKLIPGIAIVLLVMGLYLAAPGRAETRPAPRAQPTETLQPNEPVCPSALPGDSDDRVVPMVACGVFQGKPCDGHLRPRCDLQPGEHALCICTNGFYECS